MLSIFSVTLLCKFNNFLRGGSCLLPTPLPPPVLLRFRHDPITNYQCPLISTKIFVMRREKFSFKHIKYKYHQILNRTYLYYLPIDNWPKLAIFKYFQLFHDN